MSKPVWPAVTCAYIPSYVSKKSELTLTLYFFSNDGMTSSPMYSA